MNAEIIAVGTELLLGDILNTDAQFLSRELSACGINLLFQSVVGDNKNRLLSLLEIASGRSNLIILTGGLGPTEDDITKETVAEFCGLPLRRDAGSMERMRDFFQRAGREVSAANEKQAMLPAGCTVFENDYGTAPGCGFEHNGITYALLPGPPRELKPMFRNRVLPFLHPFFEGVIHSENLRIFGIPESDLQDLLQDLMRGSNPTLSPYAKEGEVLLRVTAKAEDAKKAAQICSPVVAEVMKRVGTALYTKKAENLEGEVVALLRNRKQKIAVAESCTGGTIAKRLTDIGGCSEVFDCGMVTYANRMKASILGVGNQTLEMFGAVSFQTACEMARGIRQYADAQLGLATTGIAGPSGGSDEKPVGLVYVALASEEGIYYRRLVLGRGGGNERNYVRELASSHALDMARLYLQGERDRIGTRWVSE